MHPALRSPVPPSARHEARRSTSRVCSLLPAVLFRLLLLGVASAAAAAPASETWNLPTGYPASNFHTKNIQQFADDLRQTTAGRIHVAVHPNGSLFRAPEIKRAVQSGQAPVGEVLLGNHANEWPVFGADTLPFVADSYEQALQLYKAQRPLVDRRLGKQGLRLLFAVPWPPQALFASKPVAGPADLAGIRFRAQSPYTARLGQLLRAQVVTVQAADLTQALATGVVEAFMSSTSTAVDARIHEHAKYMYETQSWLPKNAVLVNAQAFGALEAPLQQAVLAAAATAEERGWAASREANVEALATLRRAGMNVLQPSADLRAGFQEVGSGMLKEWLAECGEDCRTIVSEYQKRP